MSITSLVILIIPFAPLSERQFYLTYRIDEEHCPLEIFCNSPCALSTIKE